jgi:hypothetical protein
MSGLMDFLSAIRLFGLSGYELLTIYTLPGVSYALIHLAKEYLNRPSEFARGMLAAIGKKKSVSDHLINGFAFTIAFLCIAFGWTLFGIWAILQSRGKAALEIERNKPDFNCLPEHLITKVKPHDAEIASYVVDPLGTVPPLPFGHLNKGWGNFLAETLDPADEMWSFYIHKGGEYGKHRFAASSDIKGYAWVRNGEITGEFITESD